MSQSRQQRRAATRSGAGRAWWASSAGRGAIAGIFVLVAGAIAWSAWPQRVPARDGSPSWSPDGTHIAYYAEQEGRGDLYVMRADGSGVRRVTNTAADEGSPAFAPDGQRLAFDADLAGNFDVYVMALDGSGRTRLTTDPARDVSPAWSPDGASIVFMSDRLSRPEFDVFRMRADGTGVERLTSSGTSWFPQYSPDGARLAFHVGRDVHVFDLASRTLTRLTTHPRDGMYPSWSPDGRRLVFMSARNGPMHLFTLPIEGGEPQPFLAMPTGSAIDPRWSPAGDRIVFVHVPEESERAAQHGSEERAIYVADVATGKYTRLSR
jgi:TolB protein